MAKYAFHEVAAALKPLPEPTGGPLLQEAAQLLQDETPAQIREWAEEFAGWEGEGPASEGMILRLGKMSETTFRQFRDHASRHKEYLQTEEIPRTFPKKVKENLRRGGRQMVDSTKQFAELYIAPMFGETPAWKQRGVDRHRRLQAAMQSLDPVESTFQNPVLNFLGTGFYDALAQAVPVGTGMAAHGLGGPAAAVPYWMVQIAPGRYNQFRELGMEPELARDLALGCSIIEGSIECAQVGELKKLFGATRALGAAGATKGLRGAGTKALLEFFKKYTWENIEEGAQAGTSELAIALGEHVSKNNIKVDWPEIRRQDLNDFGRGMGAMFWLTGTPAALGYAYGRITAPGRTKLDLPENGPNPLVNTAMGTINAMQGVDPSVVQRAISPEPAPPPQGVPITPRSPTPAPDSPQDGFAGVAAARHALAAARNRSLAPVTPESQEMRNAVESVVRGSPIDDGWLKLILVGAGRANRTHNPLADFGGPRGAHRLPVVQLQSTDPGVIGHELGEAAWIIAEEADPVPIQHFTSLAERLGEENPREFFAQLVEQYVAHPEQLEVMPEEEGATDEAAAARTMRGIMSRPPAFNRAFGVSEAGVEDATALTDEELVAELDMSRRRGAMHDGGVGKATQAVLDEVAKRPGLMKELGVSSAEEALGLTGEQVAGKLVREEGEDNLVGLAKNLENQKLAREAEKGTAKTLAQESTARLGADLPAVISAAQEEAAVLNARMDAIEDDDFEAINSGADMLDRLEAIQAQAERAQHLAGTSHTQIIEGYAKSVFDVTSRDPIREARQNGIHKTFVTDGPTERRQGNAFYNRGELAALAEAKSYWALAELIARPPWQPNELLKAMQPALSANQIAIVPGKEMRFHAQKDTSAGYKTIVNVPRAELEGVRDAEGFTNELLGRLGAEIADPELSVAGEITAFSNEIRLDPKLRTGLDFVFRHTTPAPANLQAAIETSRPSAILPVGHGNKIGGWVRAQSGGTVVFYQEGESRASRPGLPGWKFRKNRITPELAGRPGGVSFTAVKGGYLITVDGDDVRAIADRAGRTVDGVEFSNDLAYARLLAQGEPFAYMTTRTLNVPKSVGKPDARSVMQSVLSDSLTQRINDFLAPDGEMDGDILPALERIVNRAGELWSKDATRRQTWNDVRRDALNAAAQRVLQGTPYAAVEYSPTPTDAPIPVRQRLDYDDGNWTFFPDSGIHVHDTSGKLHTNTPGTAAAATLEAIENRVEQVPQLRAVQRAVIDPVPIALALGQKNVSHTLAQNVNLAHQMLEKAGHYGPYRYGATPSGHVAIADQNDQVVAVLPPADNKAIHGYVLSEMAEGRYTPALDRGANRPVAGQADFSKVTNTHLGTRIREIMNWPEKGPITYADLQEATGILSDLLPRKGVMRALSEALGEEWRGWTLPERVPPRYRAMLRDAGIKIDHGHGVATDQEWEQAYAELEGRFDAEPGDRELGGVLDWMRRRRLSHQQQATPISTVPRTHDGEQMVDVRKLELARDPETGEAKLNLRGIPTSADAEQALTYVAQMRAALPEIITDAAVQNMVGNISSAPGLSVAAQDSPKLATAISREIGKRFSFLTEQASNPLYKAERAFAPHVAHELAQQSKASQVAKTQVADWTEQTHKALTKLRARKDWRQSAMRIQHAAHNLDVQLDAEEQALANILMQADAYARDTLVNLREAMPDDPVAASAQQMLNGGIGTEEINALLSQQAGPDMRFYLPLVHAEGSGIWGVWNRLLAEPLIQGIFGQEITQFKKFKPVDPLLMRTGARGPAEFDLERRLEVRFRNLTRLIQLRAHMNFRQFMAREGLYRGRFVPDSLTHWVNSLSRAPVRPWPLAPLRLLKPLTGRMYKALLSGLTTIGINRFEGTKAAARFGPTIWAESELWTHAKMLTKAGRSHLRQYLADTGISEESRYWTGAQPTVYEPTPMGRVARGVMRVATAPYTIPMAPLIHGFETAEFMNKVVTAKAQELFAKEHPEQVEALMAQTGRSYQEVLRTMQHHAISDLQFAPSSTFTFGPKILGSLRGGVAFMRFPILTLEYWANKVDATVAEWRRGNYTGPATRETAGIIGVETLLGLGLWALGANLWYYVGPGKLPVSTVENWWQMLSPHARAGVDIGQGLSKWWMDGSVRGRQQACKGIVDALSYSVPGSRGAFAVVKGATDIDVKKAAMGVTEHLISGEGLNAKEVIEREVRQADIPGVKTRTGRMRIPLPQGERMRTLLALPSLSRAQEWSGKKAVQALDERERYLRGNIRDYMYLGETRRAAGDMDGAAEAYQKAGEALNEYGPVTKQTLRGIRLSFAERTVPAILQAVVGRNAMTHHRRATSPGTAKEYALVIKRLQPMARMMLETMTDEELTLAAYDLPKDWRIPGPQLRKVIKYVFEIR